MDSIGFLGEAVDGSGMSDKDFVPGDTSLISDGLDSLLVSHIALGCDSIVQRN